jgi:hypothetical protein
MSKQIVVEKISGEKQLFQEEKLIGSILKAGATRETAEKIVGELQLFMFDGITTREIYRRAFQMLRKNMHFLAARYSLKSAIMELGPSGYPFEKYIGEMFAKQGFKVKTGQILPGKCVTHEVDVVAEKPDLTIMAECKYHNEQGKVNSVQTPLYVNSRFLDIRSEWEKAPQNKSKTFQVWLVTNTRFSGDAEEYGTCAGLHLLSWDFPKGNALKEHIESMALFPVTVITGLNSNQKQILLEKDIILCSHLHENIKLLDSFELTPKKKKEIVNEVQQLCSI